MPKHCHFASDELLKQKLIHIDWQPLDILNTVDANCYCARNVYLSFDFNLGMNKWRINMDKLKPINITRADSLLFQHIPYHPVIRGSPYLNGNVLKCTSQGAKADLFSQDLQICFTWNILYFAHNPPNTPFHLSTSICFLFSQATHLPRSELLMHSDKLNSSRAQRIQTYRYKRLRKQCWCHV